MTCHKAKSLIPLFVGDDLRPGRGRAVRAHIEGCPDCRAELESHRQALARLKAAAKAENVPDWSEGEWKSLMVRAATGARGAGEAAKGLGGRALRPSWSAASALGALLCLVVLGLLFRGPSVEQGRPTKNAPLALAAENTNQDRVTVTMVSPETGLQIVWFLDKNFDWKGEKE
jgi:hypothetical protein